MAERISFFDAADANKRNSLILVAAMFFIFLAAAWAISYIFDLGICGPVLGFFGLIFYTLIVYFQGDSIILAISGAREAKREDSSCLMTWLRALGSTPSSCWPSCSARI